MWNQLSGIKHYVPVLVDNRILVHICGSENISKGWIIVCRSQRERERERGGELGSWRVWPVERGDLLLLCTWSHLQYVWGSVLAHLFIWLVIPTCIWRLITHRYLGHFTVFDRFCFLKGLSLYGIHQYETCRNPSLTTVEFQRLSVESNDNICTVCIVYK
jgi:hypothetical protein